jgi:hypothetical protein
MNPKLRRQLRQGLLPRKRCHRHSRPRLSPGQALNSALCCFLFMPTSHAPLDRSAFSLSRCPKIRSRRTTSWLASVWANENLPTPQEQADRFIEFLGAANRIPSEWVPCYPQRLGGILGTADDPTSRDIRGLTHILSRLTDKGLIEQPTETTQFTHDGAISTGSPSTDGSASTNSAADRSIATRLSWR